MASYHIRNAVASVALMCRRSVWRFLSARLASRRFYVESSRLACKCVFSAAVFAVFGCIALALYDRYLDLAAGMGPAGQPVLPGHDLELREKSIRTLELFPYTGWHIQSDFAHRGPMPWEANADEEYDVRTGRFAFFVDFDIENPPPKKANEYRIVLIGGSGAQGWGGQSNEKMLYRRLEQRLNERFSKLGRTFTVINMAMGSSITYQNYIALNRWGHALKSIKRDFQGIPIMVAWQALAPDEIAPGAALLGDDFYNKMFEQAREGLAGYLNEKWLFLNVHRHFQSEPRPPGVRGHLSGEGHGLVADLIAREIGVGILGAGE